MLVDLGIPVPGQERCELLMAQEIARDVAGGYLDPCRGAAAVTVRMGADRVCERPYRRDGRCRCLSYVLDILDIGQP